jgi:hypothetical protein
MNTYVREEVWLQAFVAPIMDGSEWSASRQYHLNPGKKTRGEAGGVY